MVAFVSAELQPRTPAASATASRADTKEAGASGRQPSILRSFDHILISAFFLGSPISVQLASESCKAVQLNLGRR
jgi:hypothetical protein